jgi:hypothetical protein
MSYESGTTPPADNFSTGATAGASTAPGGGLSGAAGDIGSNTTDELGGRDLGTLSNDRTNLGGTSVSSGSLTDAGRADATGGMTGDTGPTTASRSSAAGAGHLGGGPSDMGGQATTLDVGSTPHGGGTGRGEGDAYGSTVVTQGGPHSYAMPMPAEAMDDTAPTAGTGGMTTSGMDDPSLSGSERTASAWDPSMGGSATLADSRDTTPGGTDREWSARSAGGGDTPPAGSAPTARADQGATPGVDYAGTADRDLDDPTTDPTAGGTGANYSGGTGGWGTEAPTSPGAAGWRPPSREAEGTSNRGETH